MFKKVIAAVDGGSGGRDAAALARDLGDTDGRLILANVHLETSTAVVHEFDAAKRDEAERMLGSVREAIGWSAEIATIGANSVAEGLHHHAERHAADLLVVGTAHRGLIGRALGGDNTRASLRCAPCAVAIAPPGYLDSPQPINIIGVGYDGSRESEAALATARELGKPRGARIEVRILVAATRFDGSRLPPMDGVMATDPRLNEMLWRLSEPDRITARAAFGLPLEELEALCAEVDLLLIGARSEDRTGLLLPDRTLRRLARSPLCPLLSFPVQRVKTPLST